VKEKVNIFWFRRDLRLHDNAALYRALKDGLPLVPVFIFDRNILDELDDREDRRVEFIHLALQQIQDKLNSIGSSLDTRYGTPEQVFPQLLNDYAVQKVFTNNDYEPYAVNRDQAIAALLKKEGVRLQTFKDHVIFEKGEIMKTDGRHYTVFTPYSRQWKAALQDTNLHSYVTEDHYAVFYKQSSRHLITLEEMNFKAAGIPFPSKSWDRDIIKDYASQRDFPAIQGTSRMSVHLRFGTISIRQLAREAGGLSSVYLNELIWRDFYQMILWHVPSVVNHSFRPEYDNIQWRNNEKEFTSWCEGRTGYPIVDAGMRELNATGFMHNRVRMITASFLCKHLLVDWRWGEAYFAKKLLDYDLASNNGGWQWSAGTGADAAPYFRIFNPYLQTKKFDPELKYIRHWIPELDELSYPQPIVEHEFARKRCLETYAKALKK
jgi:deoxyribodipyrimidine photo-lyase